MLRSTVWVAAVLCAPACKTERCPVWGSVDSPWVSVSVGGNQSCGIKEDGTLLCWGGAYEGETCPPEEEFAQVSVGNRHACGVTTDQQVFCWGTDADGDTLAPGGAAVEVAAGENFSCGISAQDGSGLCWGNNQYSQGNIPDGLSHIDVGQWHGCGIQAGGAHGVECWGQGNWGVKLAPKDGGYVGISVGAAHSCAIKDKGQIVCWGADGNYEYHQDEVPTGSYTRVAAGAYATCAIDSFDELVCWGDPTDGVTTSPPDGTYVEVAVGGTLGQTQHACALKTNGKMVCWGNNSDEQTVVLPEWNP
jgi:alpha-tubulin suppressor-like RCC1 family protein